jgi:hypothetical protein
VGVRLLRGLGRALWWNLVAGTVTAFAVACAFAWTLAHDPSTGDDVVGIVFIVGVPIGMLYGLAAGVVHWVAQVPLLAWHPRHGAAAVRVLATAVSAGLVAGLVLLGSDESLWNPVMLMFAPYVLVTPFVAARGYDAAG